MDKNKIKENIALRKKIRITGFVLLAIGLICVLIAFIDFFGSAFSMSGAPSLFFLFFIGFPFVAGGASCLRYGYMGSIAKYQAGEITPVAKDVINYMVDGTKDEIADAIKVIKNGTSNYITCPKCENKNDSNARFCDNCGSILKKTCKFCAEENDGDAKFCNNCGKSL